MSGGSVGRSACCLFGVRWLVGLSGFVSRSVVWSVGLVTIVWPVGRLVESGRSVARMSCRSIGRSVVWLVG